MSEVVNWRLGLDDSFQTERRAAVSGHPTLCGIDYVEVDALADGWNLLVHFVPPARAVTGKAAVPGGISPVRIRITASGGDAAPLRVANVSYPEAGGDVLTIQLRAIGDAEAARPMGRYRLELSNIAALDPLCATATFSLASAAGGLVDSGTARADSTDRRPSAEIDYLAKDYASFRRLMFDHLSLHAPQWRERHAADFGVALVEVMAYAADYLSHYQDAVATESYLGTARRRESVRRHARLLDYPVHDGCNGRVWIQFQVDADEVPLPQGATLLTRVPTHGTRVSTQVYREQFLPGDRSSRVFETMHAAVLSQEHNEIPIYAWGARRYALDKGATAAALEGEFPRLKAGDVLVIEEVRGPLTGPPAEARCHAVRLTDVRATSDPLRNQSLTEIRWASGDALPHRVPVAGKTIDSGYIPGLSVARGNVVLADHGRTIRDERLSPAPSTGRYRPRLLYADVTFRAPYDHRGVRSQAATGTLEQTPTDALPAVTLVELGDAETGASASPARGQAWTARPDLLSSGPFTPAFVIETGNEGEIEIRFGDGCHGKRPFPGKRFKAAYRIGNGPYGNVGAETITHVVSDDGRITGVRNPMPARGGSERESIESVRLCASEDFREQRRCITEGDYAAAAERHPDVHQARARLRWTGSWHTVFIHVHRRTAEPADNGFRRELENRLEPLRAAGRDLAIRAPQYVPILLGLIVEVAPNHARNAVRRTVLDALGNRTLPDGLHGLFHPENLGFGESLHQSQVVTRAQEVSGVARVEADRFQRGDRPGDPRLAERLSAGPLEILRLDNDPQAPQYGTLVLTLRGGLS